MCPQRFCVNCLGFSYSAVNIDTAATHDSPGQPTSLRPAQRAGHEFSCLCLTGGASACAWKVACALDATHILRACLSAAIGINNRNLVVLDQCALCLTRGRQLSLSAQHERHPDHSLSASDHSAAACNYDLSFALRCMLPLCLAA